MLIGDSIVNNIFKSNPNRQIWENEFGRSYLNYGVGGDHIKNVLWRIQFHKFPPAICDTVIIQVGTNDVTNCRCDIDEIAEGIMQVVTEIHKIIRILRYCCQEFYLVPGNPQQ